MVRLNTHSALSLPSSSDESPVVFEVFVQNEFSDFEVSSVISTLSVANQVLTRERFRWTFISDSPGLVESRCGMMVRAEPAIFDHNLRDFLVVVGGNCIASEGWMPRVRAMQRRKRLVAVLSDAATSYIKGSRDTEKKVTTHWRDVQILEELGDYPNLSDSYAESHSGIVTSAGTNYTSELIIRLIAKYLSSTEYSEIGSRLLVQAVRDTQSEQPKGASYLVSAFGTKISNAIAVMEENLSEPVSTRTISEEIGLSVRQLERLFTQHFGTSPGRYYRKVRLVKAHALVTETNLKIIDVALATGFGSVSSLISAYRSEFGVTPRVTRSSRRDFVD